MSTWKWIAAAGTALVLLGAGAVWWFWPWTPPCDLSSYADPTRGAVPAAADPSGPAVVGVTYLDQGWSPRDSLTFYTTTQGSRLLPYSWFLALEQADNDRPFRDPAHVQKLRYLPQKVTPCNPDALPVGFVRDPRRGDEPNGRDWLGFTCAACHTAELHYEGVAYRIDGGPTAGDMGTLLTELTRALKATHDDPAKFERFAAKVVKSGTPDADRESLRRNLAEQVQARTAYDAMNATDHPYGYARLDAFGRILNAVLVEGVGAADPGQRKPPDAPVSYPFLWDTPQHPFVQWNGVAQNKVAGSAALGALSRNVGEVLGVFGTVDTTELKPGYQSSVQIPNLRALETLLRGLHSPAWPAAFPPIDAVKRDAGKKLFKDYCLKCHVPIEDPANPDREVLAFKTALSEVRTDPRMATNFANRKGKTGRLEGRRKLVVNVPFPSNPKLEGEESGDTILLHTVVGTILNGPFNDTTDADKEAQLSALRARTATASVFGTAAFAAKPNPMLVYKARPLNGAWATAPFLHNGSVPNLYELLLPAEQRSKTFTVGSRQFDPVRVGYRTAPFDGGFVFDAARPGTSNAGHEYGTGKPKSAGGDDLPALTEEQRWQLVEYLKSL